MVSRTFSRTVRYALFILIPFASVTGGEEEALDRLLNITDGLQSIGEQVLGEPVTGTLVTGDSLELELSLDRGSMYHVHIYSDSYFNVLDIWLADPSGTTQGVAAGDHALITVYPDTSGTWTLNLLLQEAASSDTASYAAAIFSRRRYTE
mgnify:CR=1 FL=1